ncbi:MAG: hypothetical protein DMF39_07805 [Verrucomicrobia bacterium]|nr:MAG: hypothetical protein DMF39_07805 [Verrucomicrobiota bacterium]
MIGITRNPSRRRAVKSIKEGTEAQVQLRDRKRITGMKGILYRIGIGSLILLLTALGEPVMGTVSLLGTVPLSRGFSHGQRYRINFVDVDGNSLSTADGHVTVLVLMTPEDREKARSIGDRAPDYCLGNPSYRMITVLNFTRRRTQIGRNVVTMLVRHQLDEEAKRLQARFDGTISSQLGAESAAAGFGVFVFGRNGELLQHWDDVPSAQELASAVK